MNTEEKAASLSQAIQNVAVAFGLSVKAVESLIEQMDDSFKVGDRLKELAKMQKRLLRETKPRQSYVSPYAKFDIYHKKRKKWHSK